ncbi:MAG: ABC transporter ATP-binding protein [Anaerolineae bacterium]
MPPLIELKNVDVTFESGGGLFSPKRQVRAVVGANLTIDEGDIVAVVGESGCGKTTLGRVVTGLQKPTAGEVLYQGKDIGRLTGADFSAYRLAVQIVHQDSFAALNPVRTIYQTLRAPLLRHGIARNDQEAWNKAAELLELMGLTPPELFLDDKYPHQLSGGQRQRMVLARAVSVQPKLIVADEPVSMVDVSLRLSLLDLMARLNREMGIAFIYITHDLATARYFAQKGRIVVMYLGQVVETGALGDVIRRPRHPYLQALLTAVPIPDPDLTRQHRELPLRGMDLPDPAKAPSGCRFHPRCPYCGPLCKEEEPQLEDIGGGHLVACHYEKDVPEWTPLSVG